MIVPWIKDANGGLVNLRHVCAISVMWRGCLHDPEYEVVAFLVDGGFTQLYAGLRDECERYLADLAQRTALEREVEAAAILGIAPPGYRLVPEEVAEKALPLVQALAEQKRVVAEELIGAEERAEAFEEHRALMALASTLQGEEVEKR